MDIQEFRKDFMEEIKATAATAGEGSTAAFVKIFTDYLINAEVLSDFTYAFYIGSGKKNRAIRADGYSLDEFDYNFTLLIADYSGDENSEVLTRTDTTQLFDKLLHFIEESYESNLIKAIEPSTPAADMVETLRYNKTKITKFRLLLITDRFMSGRISTLEARTFNGIPVECQVWDIDRLYRVCCSELGRQEIEIDFKGYTQKGIPCLQVRSTDSDEYQSLLCIIPGQTLADIYDNYGSLLLEGNVRSFLSTKVAVNKKIRETVLKYPDKFFAYNNGVSATAMDLVIETSEQGKFVTYAKDFQIINGGQTTASLSNSRYKDKADLSKIFVQMKLTKIDADADKATSLIRNISKSSNSQNKVSEADFFATHPFHVRMEQLSRRLYAPAVGGAQYETKWFYERARGQYLQQQMRMTKSEKAKFIVQNPKKQVITKTDLAKIRNSWDGLPQFVSRGAQTNFMKFAEIIDEAWTKSENIFNELYFKESAALMKLFLHTEDIVSNQTWYEKGYRANIVTYSIALFHEAIQKQYPDHNLDLMMIWNRQEVPESVTNELVKITKQVFDIITDPNRETINVTQWCKRDSCWRRIQTSEVVLNEDIQKSLISLSEKKTAVRDAQIKQKFISEVEAQVKVLEYGADFWKQVNSFALNKGIGSPEIMIAMNCAMRMPSKLPNTYQSLKLLEVLEMAESEGFKPN